MPNSILIRFYLLMGLLAALLVMLCASCQSHKGQPSPEPPPLPKIEKMVVVGFLPAMSRWDAPNMVRSPISGAVFSGSPVTEQAVNSLTASLFNRIVKQERFELVSPGQARGFYSSLKLSDVVGREMEVIKKIGRAFSAEGVLIGYLYRYRERKGTNYAVDSPASVAFELSLIGPQKGILLWRGRFDKTQQHLTQNVLDMDTFMRGQGRWMTAESLAEIGLENVLGSLTQALDAEKKD